MGAWGGSAAGRGLRGTRSPVNLSKFWAVGLWCEAGRWGGGLLFWGPL